MKRPSETFMEDATDRKLTLNKSSPNEKASEDDMNQMGAAGENESKQQTEGAGRELNIHTITFLNYFDEAIMESGEAETVESNRIENAGSAKAL